MGGGGPGDGQGYGCQAEERSASARRQGDFGSMTSGACLSGRSEQDRVWGAGQM